ncbi:hypothetical protein PIB30_040383 [Stylosanthes scabra]|uniref:Thaumatin-like protein n=1 Tax=Stylosanthes scabra TaxID=79078 RepID=A0ABU6ZD94_9FABA|nr:hypothetical protein [Stylosanthes scabra]
MGYSLNLPLCSILIFASFLTLTNTANFEIVNNCPYTVWAAASPGGHGTSGWHLASPWAASGVASGATSIIMVKAISRPEIAPVDSMLGLGYGFNIPMDFYLLNGGCHKISCTADIIGQCPNELRVPGGCNNACPVFHSNEYCCPNPEAGCGPTYYSTFFKDRCPDAFSYPKDNATNQFTCPAGTNYRVVTT